MIRPIVSSIRRRALAFFAEAERRPDRSIIGKPPLTGPESLTPTPAGNSSRMDVFLNSYLSGNPAAENHGVVANESYRATRGGQLAWSRDASVYDRWQEILDKNLHVAALVEQRMAMITEREKVIITDAQTPKAQEAADFVRRQLFELNDGFGFTARMEQMLGAVFFGFMVHEIMWEPLERGAVGIRRLPHRWLGQFAFDAEARLHIVSGNSAKLEPAPPNKFVVTRTGFPILWDNPYGAGVLHKLRTLDLIKRNAERFWAIYVELHGSPTIIATIKRDAPDKQRLRDDVRNALAELGRRMGIVVEDNVTFEHFSRSMATGRISTYNELIRYVESLEARLILGSTLTTVESEVGSRAQAVVHETTTEKRVDPDARRIMDTVNAQLIGPLLAFNYAPGELAPEETPYLLIETRASEDLDTKLERYLKLQKMGVDVSVAHLREVFSAPAPTGPEDTPVMPATDITDTADITDATPTKDTASTTPTTDMTDTTHVPRVSFSESRIPPEAMTRANRLRRVEDLLIRPIARLYRREFDAYVQRVGVIAGGPDAPITEASLSMAGPLRFTNAESSLLTLELGLRALAFTDFEADYRAQVGKAFPILRPGADAGALPAFRASTFADVARFEDIEPYREALEWFEDRDILTQEQGNRYIEFLQSKGVSLEDAVRHARARALFLAGNIDTAVTALVRDSLAAAVRQGLTFEEWRKVVLAGVEPDRLPGGGTARLEVIYRNETNTVYHRQREELYSDPFVREQLEGFEWYNPADERSRPDHAALVGFIPLSSPWANVTPPLDHNCRCGKYPVFKRPGVAPPQPAPDLNERWAAASRFES